MGRRYFFLVLAAVMVLPGTIEGPAGTTGRPLCTHLLVVGTCSSTLEVWILSTTTFGSTASLLGQFRFRNFFRPV